jgi:hypothetical protein
MIVALFVIAVVVSMPIVATVIVSIASRREDAAFSLAEPARGAIRGAARQIVAFHTDEAELPRPVHLRRARAEAPVSVSQLRRGEEIDSPRPVVVTKLTVRSAA